MNTLAWRLRISLLLAPALLLIHVWMIAMSSGSLLQIWGVWRLFAMAVGTSIVESYVIILAVSAVFLRNDKGGSE